MYLLCENNRMTTLLLIRWSWFFLVASWWLLSKCYICNVTGTCTKVWQKARTRTIVIPSWILTSLFLGVSWENWQPAKFYKLTSKTWKSPGCNFPLSFLLALVLFSLHLKDTYQFCFVWKVSDPAICQYIAVWLTTWSWLFAGWSSQLFCWLPTVICNPLGCTL